MYEWTTLYAHQRAKELRQDREKQRIIQEALAARGKREPIYAPVLAEIGRQLAEWGAQLQERYDHTEAPVTQ
jgi:hypothetical protein